MLLEQIDDSKNGLKEDFLRRYGDDVQHRVFFFSYYPKAKAVTGEKSIYMHTLCLFSDFDFYKQN